jgi:hypothetical protein
MGTIGPESAAASESPPAAATQLRHPVPIKVTLLLNPRNPAIFEM